MKILAIGNSFSQDATRYLHQIAKMDGQDLKVINLYIGGCSLKIHYINCIDNNKNYEIEFNGVNTGFRTSIKDAIISDDWDVITLQQASYQSISYETYQPYLNHLIAYIKRYAPKSKIYLHQTWAYEEGSDRLIKELGYQHAEDMLFDIKLAYQKASQEIKADGIIPSGELFGLLINNGILKVYRDTFHASYGIGRYALSLLWYQVLCKKDIMQNAFFDFDEIVTEEEKNKVKALIAHVF
jgi:hypothetical protein